MIICDDHSSDNTLDRIKFFQTKDSRIKLVENNTNTGPAIARNKSLSIATGRWLAFLDADDFWLEQKLEKTLRFAICKDSALTYTSYRKISMNNSKIGCIKAVPETLTYREILGNTAIATSTVLIDRKKVPDIKMKNTYYDDFVCWATILKSGFTAYGLNVDLVRYRTTYGSVSRNKIKSAIKVWETYRMEFKLGLIESFIFFMKYVFNGILKYSRF